MPETKGTMRLSERCGDMSRGGERSARFHETCYAGIIIRAKGSGEGSKGQANLVVMYL